MYFYDDENNVFHAKKTTIATFGELEANRDRG